MRKDQRDAERIIAQLGLSIVEKYTAKHLTFVLRAPNGRTLNAQLAGDMTAPRQWNNWRTQLRKRINELDQKAATNGAGPRGPKGSV